MMQHQYMLNLSLNMLQFIGKLISTLFLRTFSPSVFFYMLCCIVLVLTVLIT